MLLPALPTLLLPLVALDATMVIRSVDGERTLAAEDYFVGPANDIESTTALRTGEILTSGKNSKHLGQCYVLLRKSGRQKRMGLLPR